MSEGLIGIEEIRAAWGSRGQKSFNIWVRLVGQSFRESNLTLEAVARGLGQTPATVEAVLQLDQLEDDELGLLAVAVPPQTTWFLFAAANREQIRRGLAALIEKKDGVSPSRVVQGALGLDDDEGLQEALRNLSGDIYKHLSKKASKYNVLIPKQRAALAGFGATTSNGRSLSDKQIAYAEGLIRKLITDGVIKRDSMDDDVEICEKILDIFGV